MGFLLSLSLCNFSLFPLCSLQIIWATLLCQSQKSGLFFSLGVKLVFRVAARRGRQDLQKLLKWLLVLEEMGATTTEARGFSRRLLCWSKWMGKAMKFMIRWEDFGGGAVCQWDEILLGRTVERFSFETAAAIVGGTTSSEGCHWQQHLHDSSFGDSIDPRDCYYHNIKFKYNQNYCNFSRTSWDPYSDVSHVTDRHNIRVILPGRIEVQRELQNSCFPCRRFAWVHPQPGDSPSSMRSIGILYFVWGVVKLKKGKGNVNLDQILSWIWCGLCVPKMILYIFYSALQPPTLSMTTSVFIHLHARSDPDPLSLVIPFHIIFY